jgi:hypothetical protein
MHSLVIWLVNAGEVRSEKRGSPWHAIIGPMRLTDRSHRIPSLRLCASARNAPRLPRLCEICLFD